MNFEIVYTDNFAKEVKRLAKKYRSLKSDLSDLIESLEEKPNQGVPIGNDCYKIRMSIKSKGKGKSGGAGIITHIYIDGATVFLLSIYDKVTISDKELNAILKHLS
ncbi:MAG: hypothetical protein JXR10_04445 [Cyclobacteriaceae bacterium]